MIIRIDDETVKYYILQTVYTLYTIVYSISSLLITFYMKYAILRLSEWLLVASQKRITIHVLKFENSNIICWVTY